jgi:hypothetical protein
MLVGNCFSTAAKISSGVGLAINLIAAFRLFIFGAVKTGQSKTAPQARRTLLSF